MKRTFLIALPVALASAVLLDGGEPVRAAKTPDQVVQADATPKAPQVPEEKFVFEKKNRIDPFTMRWDVKPPPPPPPGPLKELPIAEQRERLDQCRKMLVEMIVNVQQKKFDEVVAAQDRIIRIRLSVTDEALRSELDTVLAQAKKVMGSVNDMESHRTLRQARTLFKAMGTAFDDEQYSQALSKHKQLLSLVRHAGQGGSETEQKVAQLVLDANRLSQRAAVRREFRENPPKIGGIFISTESMIILDSQPVMEGEVHRGMTILKIELKQVTFLFKGEKIVHHLD